MSTGTVPLRLKLYNASGGIAFGIKDNGFSVFLLTFYNQVLGMDAWLVSLALVIALVVDAMVDPFIGSLSDRTYTRWGRRLPWLYAAPIPLAVAWYFLWSPATGAAASFWSLLGLAIVVRLLLSACEVPSIALVPEITRDYDERTTLFRYRYLLGWTSGLATLALAYQVFLRDDLLSLEGYRQYGLFGAVGIAVAVLFSAVMQHRYVAGYPASRPPPFKLRQVTGEIRHAFSEPAFLIFAAGALAAYISQGMTFALSNYLYYFVWQLSEGELAVYPLVLFFSVLAVFFALGPLHRRMGKARTGALATILSMTTWLIPYALEASGAWPQLGTHASAAMLFAFVFTSNGASVAAVISATSMVAEVIEAHEENSGRRAEASFYAGNWLVQKCATGLGILLAGTMLTIAEFPSGVEPGQVAPAIIGVLVALYCAAVLVLGMVSAYWLARFPISREQHEERLARLAEIDRAGGAACAASP